MKNQTGKLVYRMKTILNIGDKLWQWEVVAFDKVDQRRNRRYICKCSCGTIASKKASLLASGRSKRCHKCKRSDLLDKVFGEWTVLSFAGTDKANKTMWLCRCSCGVEKVLVGSRLKSGKSKSCFHCSVNANRDVKIIPIAWWAKTRSQAVARNRKWEITEDQCLALLDSQRHLCALSGLPIGFGKSITASLDRIDSDKDYTIDNVQWLHKHINMMKARYSQEYFVKMCHLVSNNNTLL